MFSDTYNIEKSIKLYQKCDAKLSHPKVVCSNGYERKSKYRGVYQGYKDKWQGRFSKHGKVHHVGWHQTEEEAAHAVNRKCDELQLDRLNPELGSPPSKAAAPKKTGGKKVRITREL